MQAFRSFAPAAAGLSAALLLSAAGGGCARAVAKGARIDVREREIEFSAEVHASSFDSGWMMPGYHAVVGAGGRMRQAALLQADVSDVQVIRALEGLGAKPGNNLSMEAWSRRRSADAPEPRVAIAGPRVEMRIRVPARRDLLLLSDALSDSGGLGIDLRFGGNEANIPAWKSGCIVCLYSCPGSKVGNSRYTERDYSRDSTRFRSRPGVLPPDGTRVGVILALLPDGAK